MCTRTVFTCPKHNIRHSSETTYCKAKRSRRRCNCIIKKSAKSVLGCCVHDERELRD